MMFQYISNNQPVVEEKNEEKKAVSANLFISKQAAENANATKVPWMPTVIQGVVQDLDDGISSLVMLVELPANVVNKALLTVKVSADGKSLDVYRPRGQIISDVGYAEKAMEHDGGKTIAASKIRLFVGVLDKALRDLRENKTTGMIVDHAKITLLEPVNPNKKLIVKLIGAGDNTCGMLVVMQTQSSEEIVSDDDMDEDRLTVYSPVNKKKRSST